MKMTALKSLVVLALPVLLVVLNSQFSIAGAQTFSDANWLSLGGFPGADGEVFAETVDNSGNLYIGGDFDAVGSTPANNIAEWNGTNWLALGSGMNGNVFALEVTNGT